MSRIKHSGAKMRLLLFFLTLAASSAALSQSLEVTVGPVIDPVQIRKEADLPAVVVPVPFVGLRYSTALFANEGTGTTYEGFGFHKKAFQFAVMRDHLYYDGIKSLSGDWLDEYVSVNAFVNIGAKLYMIHSKVSANTNELMVMVNEMDEDMVVQGSPIVLRRFPNVREYGKDLYISSSPDKSHWLLARLLDTKGNDPQRIEASVFDQSFAEVWSRELKIDEASRNLPISSLELDNAGNCYLLAQSRYDFSYYFGVTTTTPWHPKLYSYSWREKAFTAFDIAPPVGHAFGVVLKIPDGENPVIAGLSSHKKSVSYFLAQWDAKAQDYGPYRFSLMPADFFKKLRKRNLGFWSAFDVVMLSNDDVVLSIARRGYAGDILHTEQVYVVSFDESGSTNWVQTIFKEQEMPIAQAGHRLIASGDKTLVVYNDHERNFSKKVGDRRVKPLSSKKGMAVAIEIDPSGKATKHRLFKENALDRYMVAVNHFIEINKTLYYCQAVKIKSLFSRQTRSVILRAGE